MQVCITVGDETFYTVQSPTVLRLIECSLEHYALQVGAGIRLGQVHGHGLACADTRDETAVLVLVSEFVESLDAVLERPDIAEAGIG